jgi:GNAT superfamily N-acetyltransferase
MDEISLRNDWCRGDVDAIVELHRAIHSQECGFDETFADYVAAPLREFAAARNERERIWIAERDGRIVGCIAIVAASQHAEQLHTAQLRWFLVTPEERGGGLGGWLLNTAIAFCRQCGYGEIMLWTEARLAAAARLYERAGFRKVEEKLGRNWGTDVCEQKYVLVLEGPGGCQ